jgi:AcrR family transcriptional regulator
VPRTSSAKHKEPSAPRSRKGERTRGRLLLAAKQVFEEDGFLDARISDIAERAEMSYGSFYHYFESKEQIFREVAEAQEALLTAPIAAGDNEPLTPYGRIHRANRSYLERYRKEAKIMGVIEEVSRYDAEVNAARMARQKHFADRSERAIRQWQLDGSVDTRVDPAIAATALGSMVARFAELWLVQGYANYDFDEGVDQLTLFWANALGLPVPREARNPS